MPYFRLYFYRAMCFSFSQYVFVVFGLVIRRARIRIFRLMSETVLNVMAIRHTSGHNPGVGCGVCVCVCVV